MSKICILKPITPGLRGVVRVKRNDLWKKGPVKSLTVGLSHTGGRNNFGRITVRHIGGGARKVYRLVDFNRRKFDDIQGTVQRIEYDPNRTAYIAYVLYSDGRHSYILSPEGLSVGDTVLSGNNVPVAIGNSLPMSSIPLGTLVHNIEDKIGQGGKYVKSAGTSARIVAKDGSKVSLRLPSGCFLDFHSICRATVGELSNPNNKNIKLGKAGASRWRGIRPSVRGVAMNPFDHPHGGGEGKTSGGGHPVTPWGKPTKGAKTRSKKKCKLRYNV